MNAPLWLSQREIRQLLDFVVDKLDSAEAQGKALTRALKLDERSFPALFLAAFESDKERYWEYIEQIAAWGWFSVQLDKPQPGQAKYQRNPRIQILNEAAIRSAVGRLERIKPSAERWREAVFSRLDAS